MDGMDTPPDHRGNEYHFVAVAASKPVVRLVDAFPLSWRLLGSPLDERSKSHVIVPFVHS